MNFNWNCPHCNSFQTVTDRKVGSGLLPLNVSGLIDGFMGIQHVAVGCSNEECRKLTLTLSVLEIEKDAKFNWAAKDGGSVLFHGMIIPSSSAKVQPSYIPASIVEDYNEACLIRDLSPKASATLARRCIQGMIRDFCAISDQTLAKEIARLKQAFEEGTAPRGVTEESIQAIDHIRKIGSYSAHLEKDISVIVPVEPGEAQDMIELIEMLFEEWYIARFQRAERFGRIAAIRADKDQLSSGSR